MSRHLPGQIHELIIEYRSDGMTFSKISKLLKVPCTTVRDICRRFHERKALSRKKGSGRPLKINSEKRKEIEKKVENNPHLSASELKNNLNLGSLEVTQKTIRNSLRRLGFKNCSRLKTSSK